MVDDGCLLNKIPPMTHQVLARKWRPRSFEEVIGQTHVVKALTNALNQSRLHHAYLFTGTRGVGKTSIARILAKCLNCAQSISATPCNVCDSCLAINAGKSLDLIEVDAASRTKVEDTLKLLSNTQYAPSSGRYKIYLIDEVHMLSGHSFNALLKTLEEPPPHVKFLLATTDPQKLPATILSRCLQFHLKHMPAQEIAGHLAEILSKEGIQYEAAALHSLAQAAEGSMRDALSLLDQAIAYGDNTVNSPEVMRLLGNTPNHHLIDIVYLLIQHNPQGLLASVAALYEQSIDFTRTLEGLLALLHQIAVIQAVPDAIVDDYWEEPEPIRQLAKTLSTEQVQLYYQIALIGRRDLPFASKPKNGFEMVLLRMLAFEPSSLTVLPKREEIKLSSNVIALPPLQALANYTKQPDWPSLLAQLKLTGMTHTLATHCSLANMTDDTVSLTLAPKHAPLLSPRQQERLTKALSDYFNKPMHLDIIISQNTQSSPAELSEKSTQEKKLAAEQTLKADNKFQNLIERFDATLITGSIEGRD